VAAFLAADDDHTLLFANSAVATVHPVTRKLPYDPVRDLVPISSASDIILAIAASDKSTIRSLAELEQAARARPGQINWTSSPGLPPFVVGGFFKKSGLDLVSVPYRDLAPALEDLREGRIGIMVHALGVLLPQVQGDRARLLAVANRDRAAIAPDTPTVVEAGYPELRMDGLLGFYGRSGMPVERRFRIATDIRAIAEDPAIRERLAPVAQAPRSSTPVEFTALLQQYREQISALAKAMGFESTQ
jgi:tripartite-type tricarboxylate transporter receptor subunit TctC